MFIIFDSNVWISELGLNSPKGSATRFFVKQKGAKVVVPEVVRLETERNLRNELTNYIADIDKNYRQLLAIFGKLKELVLPDKNAIEEKVAAIFQASQLDTLEIPLSLESARKSFVKTIDKIAPSDKDQQFKDGVIWAECLNLLKEDDGFLISRDKAFYQDRKYENGLAKALALEAMQHAHKLQLFPSVSELLQEIEIDIILDGAILSQDFITINKKSIDSILSRNGFSLSGNPTVHTSKYATEDPNRLYVEFELSYECEDITASGRSDAKLILRGDCTYVTTETRFSNFRNYGEELAFKTIDGETKNIRNTVLFIDSIVMGHKTVEHSVKYKIE